MRRSSLALAIELVVVFVAYVLSARLGLTLAPVSGFATLVWPPTGIALAALLLGGLRLWPAVMLGAAVANAWNGASFWVATGIGIGNTLEALLAAFLLTRVARIHVALDRLVDVLGLVGLAAALSTMVSATIGLGVLRAGGIAAPGELGEAWRAWWVGDALGALVVAPLLLTWSGFVLQASSMRKVLEAGALAVVTVGLSWFVFLSGPPLDPTPFRQAHLVFPVLIWAALRFGPRAATATLFLVSVFAVWGTLTGHGPFIGATPSLSLLNLQISMAVASITTLVLAATSTERMEALRAEQELLAIVSHDMKNPLGALRLAARQLLTQPPEELGPQPRKLGEFIARCAGRMDSLIGSLLDAATIRTGHLSLVREPQELSALVREAADTIQPLAEEKSQALQIEAPALVRVDGDRERLLQVLSNLLGNAVKFAPRGGTITATTSVEDGWAQCSVTDDGPGIAPEELDRVFEPFWSGRSSQGTGLGLSIVTGIVEAHGGTIWARSEPGTGTTIAFRLPLASTKRAGPKWVIPRLLTRKPRPG